MVAGALVFLPFGASTLRAIRKDAGLVVFLAPPDTVHPGRRLSVGLFCFQNSRLHPSFEITQLISNT